MINPHVYKDSELEKVLRQGILLVMRISWWRAVLFTKILTFIRILKCDYGKKPPHSLQKQVIVQSGYAG
ncbi:hypothetical protein CJP73_06340 [Neopusillimonas maritima]|uniref:Uncharacterized protein n=1 Tax=Neopusillimonas maritima TaxID=2026239 RepID=A0A3A1YZR9_9BURK|nr:hypothetical protein CJP73_06340 [Neopusillimonas maritima]